MILERQKYRAEVFKICGFALMTPFGRFVLSTIEHGFRNLTFDSLGNLLTSFILFLFGIMAIQVGYEEVFEE